MAGDDRRSGEQAAEVGGAHRLAELRPHRDQILGEGAVGPEEGFDGHRRGDVGDAQQPVEIGDGEHEHAEHPVGAVDQGEPFLGPQDERLEIRLGEGGGAVDQAAVGAARLALAEQHQRDRGQRGEVAAGAERAVLGDHRRESRVEQAEDRLDHFGPRSGVAHGQTAGPQQHHRPDDLALDLDAHPGGVGPDQRELELGGPLRRDHRVGEGTEAGGHPIDRVGQMDETFDHGRAPYQRGARVVAQRDRSVLPGDGDDVIGGHAARTENESGLHGADGSPRPARARTFSAA